MTDTTASGLPAATTGRARVLWSDETQPDTSIGSRKATPAQVVAEALTVTSGLMAVGTNQATALALTGALNVITGGGAVAGAVLPAVPNTPEIVVLNRDATPKKIYPATGGGIETLAPNLPVSIAAGARVVFTWLGSGQWLAS